MRSEVLRWLSLCIAVAASFVAGFISHPLLTRNVCSGERHQSELDAMRYEASSFFYDAMMALFDGTYSVDKNYVSPEALATFQEYHLKLDRRCSLINVYPDYGSFSGDAMFPSGDIFEVVITETHQGWRLDKFRHLGTTLFYYDLVHLAQPAFSPGKATPSR